MKGLLRLYPRDWRGRYEAEVAALLEEQRASPAVILDLLRGALDAHLRPQLGPTGGRGQWWVPPGFRRAVPTAGQRGGGGRAMLHVTNGDATVGKLRQAGLPGTILPWRDVLHEGPVPAGLSLDALSRVRARFIADQGWGAHDEILAGFAERDATLARFGEHEEVVLWFEHDLYDQLQLIQILDWLAARDLGATRLSLICIDHFPGVANFKGLGQLAPADLASLYPGRRAITAAELGIGRAAWAAFRSPTPTAIETVAAGDTTPLPFLGAALRRHLEQFPAVRNGLSRTERQILEVIAAGAHGPVEIFLAEGEKEASAFMGDSALWRYLHGLSATPRPLLAVAGGGPVVLPLAGQGPRARHGFGEQIVELTEWGRKVLSGRLDWLRLHRIDRWLGGVHLRAEAAPWRWDASRGSLVRVGV